MCFARSRQAACFYVKLEIDTARMPEDDTFGAASKRTLHDRAADDVRAFSACRLRGFRPDQQKEIRIRGSRVAGGNL